MAAFSAAFPSWACCSRSPDRTELRPAQPNSYLRLAKVLLRINQLDSSVSAVVDVEDLKAALAAVEHTR